MSQRHEINPFTTTFRHDLLPVILIPGGNVGNRSGMREIRVGMPGIRVGMRGIGVGMQGI